MKLFKKWGDWVDIDVREESNGTHYLLQMKVREDGKKKFKNRNLDASIFIDHLFHQDHTKINEKILKD